MAETAPTARMAEWLSDQIFDEFGWQRRPPRDTNWACVTARHHKKEGKKVHTSDAVFTYDHPYQHDQTYLTTDLKSYASSSIQKAKIRDALRSLAESADCANKSEEFQKLYVNDASAWKVEGLLFVLNNDSKFSDDFYTKFESIASSGFKLKPHLRLFVLGPEEVRYLLTVAADIRDEFGKGRLPQRDKRTFFHPNLYRARPKSNYTPSAPIETLLAPWQILYHSNPATSTSGFYLYYRGKGETPDEFKFIIDYLFRFHLVHQNVPIVVKITRGDKAAITNFEIAKEQYGRDYHKLPEFMDRLKLIEVAIVPWRVMDVWPEQVDSLD
jgi:hypothetical protein